VTRYGAPAIALHWLVAALVLATFPLGLYMTGMPLSPRKLQLISYHKWIGVTVFALAWLRLAWRLHRPAPPFPPSMAMWQQRAAHAVHGLLYVLLIAIPLSGWLYSSASGVPTVYLGLWQLPDLVDRDKALAGTLRGAHRTLNWTLAALVALHVLAALKHQLLDRDGLLHRMLPSRRR
jgi:cytochrome b561